MDAGGVDAAILTPHTPWDPNANELCIEAARAHPDRFAILGNFALDKPESRALGARPARVRARGPGAGAFGVRVPLAGGGAGRRGGGRAPWAGGAPGPGGP